MAVKKKQWLPWVKRENFDQCLWVIKKLEAKGLCRLRHDPAISHPFDRIQTAIAFDWPDPDLDIPAVFELAKTCTKLRDAWTSHKRRLANENERLFTFTMKKRMQPKIKSLSNLWGTTRSGAIEMLIETAGEARKEAREEVSGELDRMKNEIEELKEKLRIARAKPSKSLLPRNMISVESQNALDMNIKIDTLVGAVSGMSDQLVALQGQLLQITKTNSNGEDKLQGHVDEGGVAVPQGGVGDQNPQCAGDVGSGELVTATEGDGRPKVLDSKQGLTEVGVANLELHHDDVTETKARPQADEQAASEAQQEEEQSVIEDSQVDQVVSGANHPEVASEKLVISELPDIEPVKDNLVEAEMCSANPGYQPITGPVELSEQVRNMGPKELPEQVALIIENVRMGAQIDENYVDQICWQYSIFKHGEEDIVVFANKKKDSILKGWQGRQK